MKALRNVGHHERIIRVGIGFCFACLIWPLSFAWMGGFIAHECRTYCSINWHRWILSGLAYLGDRYLQSQRSYCL